jgi:hypothetical protein
VLRRNVPETWLQPLPTDYDGVLTYGDVLNNAMPECMARVTQCNLDKQHIQQWNDAK